MEQAAFDAQSLIIPRKEETPKVEKETSRVVKVFQGAFNRFKDAFTKKQETGQISEAERVDFVRTNTEIERTDGATKLDVQSFMVPNDVRRTVRVSVPADAILNFLKTEIDTASGDDVQKLQEEHDLIKDNCKPFLRNQNRKSLVDPIVDRQATLIARAIDGSDSEKGKYLQRAQDAVRNGLEFVPPNPNVRMPIEETMIPEVQLPPSNAPVDILNYLSRSRERGMRGLDRTRRNPVQEAQHVIRMNRQVEEAEARRQREVERAAAERRAMIVSGALREKTDMLLSKGGDIAERIKQMNDSVASMNTAVANLEPVQPATPDASLDTKADAALANVNLWEPLTLAEHPEEYDALLAEPSSSDDAGALGAPEMASATATAVMEEPAARQELSADQALRPDTDHVPQPETSRESSTGSPYVALHNANMNEGAAEAVFSSQPSTGVDTTPTTTPPAPAKAGNWFTRLLGIAA